MPFLKGEIYYWYIFFIVLFIDFVIFLFRFTVKFVFQGDELKVHYILYSRKYSTDHIVNYELGDEIRKGYVTTEEYIDLYFINRFPLRIVGYTHDFTFREFLSYLDTFKNMADPKKRKSFYSH